MYQFRSERRKAFAFITVMFALCLIFQGAARAQHESMTPALSRYLNMVYSGDVSDAPRLFEDYADDHGALMIKDKFTRRFVTGDDGLDLSAIEDATVRKIAELFQAYWRDALMQPALLASLDTGLKARLRTILETEGMDVSAVDEDQLLEAVEELIRRKGYFALTGRTPPLLELMIWTTNRVTTTTVELTDGSFEVELNSLDDFVSYGWSNFATFGMASTGGWAKKDGLYCLCGHYDPNSEKFQLSFLKHEGRHYVDLNSYPDLQASDMEYRGKLTELAYSQEATFKLIEHFANGANKVPNAPHPLANWYVIDRLSKLLFDGEGPVEASEWEAVPKARIRDAARRLLEEHTAALNAQGGPAASGVINA
jgi:hypothetical protein